MRKVIILIGIAFVLIFPKNIYCTIPWPIPEREENLVEKFKLYDIDKVVIKAKFSENYLGRRSYYDQINTID